MIIDRIAPCRRPDQAARGFQKWRSLLFLHWPVPIEQLRPLVPAGLELDLWDDEAYVGLVPFAMEAVRPAWCPAALGFRFLETNVRTYVVCQGRPGVYFMSLDAASRIGVWAARRFWGLPYFYARMSRHEQEEEIEYSSVRASDPDARHRSRFRCGPRLPDSELGSAEHFFLERYLLFLQRDGRLFEGQVHHTPYPAHRAEVLEVEDGLAAAVGLPPCVGAPRFAHYSPGVDVEVFALREVA